MADETRGATDVPEKSNGTGSAGHPDELVTGASPTGVSPGARPSPPGTWPPPPGTWPSPPGTWPSPPATWPPPPGGWPPPPGAYSAPPGVPAPPPGGWPPAPPGSWFPPPGPWSQEHPDRPGPYGQPGSYGQSGPSGQPSEGGAHPTGGYPGPPHFPPPGWSWPAAGPPPPRRPARTPEERRRWRRGILLFAALLLVAVGAGIGIGAAVAPTSPAAVAAGLVTKAQSAAAAAGSFHYEELSTTGGVGERIVGDAAASGGTQTITQSGGSGTDLFHLRLVHGVVYFQGNLPAVVDQLGATSTKAPSVAGKWVEVTKGEKPYTTFAQGITAKSNIAQLHTVFVARSSAPVRGSSPPTTEVTGGMNTGKGQAVGSASLLLTTSNDRPQRLAAQAVGATGHTSQLRWTFDHYGQHVSVVAPQGAQSYASLGLPSSKGAKGSKSKG